MPLNINNVIYFYMFICVALFLFNVLYIVYSKRKNRTQIRQNDRWDTILKETWQEIEQTGSLPENHRRLLESKLRKVNQLISYHNALEPHLNQEIVQHYLALIHDTFQVLAAFYLKRPAMERAFFAYLISLYHPDQGREHDQLVELLLEYMRDSTVYCRENVLKAIYAMGNAGAVEHAFSLLSELELYHHPRLVSDGLMTFTGSKTALAWRLWNHINHFSEPLQIASVQFATQLSDEFSSSFLSALKNPQTPLEVRFALTRYFFKHHFPDALPFLLSFAEDADASGNGLAISACSALAAYPGESTMAALEKSLHSRNWYVRQNAASSLISFGYGQEELDRLKASGDRYAAEMLEYMLQLQNQRNRRAAL